MNIPSGSNGAKLRQPCGLSLWPSELKRPDFRIEPGYYYTQLEECEGAFRFIILSDIDALPQLLHDCCTLVSDESFFILEYYPDEVDVEVEVEDENTPVEPTVFYSPYLPTEEILEILQPYLSRLIHDGFVGFGIANNRLGAEIFYSEEKALTIFTANHIRTMDILSRYHLRHRAEILFPADFAHNHLSLSSIPQEELPPELRQFGPEELDYVNYCAELVDLFFMSATSDTDNFFLSAAEQDAIAEIMLKQNEIEWDEEEEFVNLLLDWKDFVVMCKAGFEDDLAEYLEGLVMRDCIAMVCSQCNSQLRHKLQQFIAEADKTFKHLLTDTSKSPLRGRCTKHPRNLHFWHWGVPREYGVELRRDLIRIGWYQNQA